MSIVNIDNLVYYGSLNYNVLLIGLHGIGKTAIIKKVFNKLYGDQWRYFSAPTLDPWVDFVGVPETVTDENGKRWLELIRPKFIANDEVKAIFFDELNRSSDKVQNAIMELTQFKTINGHKLNNLDVIWGAINPPDEEDTYKVNAMDPAFTDRFHVHKELPYKLDEEYFHEKYPFTSKHFIDWWNSLPEIQKLKVSPRRLDYAAEAHQNKCRLEDFLPFSSGVKALRDSLMSEPFQDKVRNITDSAKALAFLKDANNATKLLDLVKMKDRVANNFFELYGKALPKELTEPFIEVVYAHKKGMSTISSIDEFINTLPNDRGTQATAALINNIDFSVVCKGGLEAELRALYTNKRGSVVKLATRIIDILIGCQVSTLSRLMWGINGADLSGDTQLKETNLQTIAKLLSKIDRDLYSPAQRVSINKKLHHGVESMRIVSDENFI